ncbi:transposase, partial [Enterococcus gilvus]
VATSNQFILDYDVYQNPTDTKTLPAFIEKMNGAGRLPRYIVADAGYGSEQNYRYLEDELPNHIALIPYSTMLKEQSKKWQSDER